MQQFPSGGAPFRGIRGVFLDAAGTLLHPAEPVGTAYARILGRHGIRLDPLAAQAAFVAAWRSRPGPWAAAAAPPGQDQDHPGFRQEPGTEVEKAWWRETVAEVVARCGHIVSLSDPDFRSAFEDLFAYYGRGNAWASYPEVPAVLRGLRAAGYRLCVVSNFDSRLHQVLRDLELREFFDAVILSGEIGAAKPDPRIFAAAAQALELPPSECLHVGDEPDADWSGAASAGFRVWELRRPDDDLASLVAALDAS